jgi:putative DNA modification/repair radical SAM protein
MNIVDARLQRKLEVLSDAAKYDASCASSGGVRRNSRDGRGLGSTTGSGICHAYTPDGRCISLLKILLTNFCVYDCAYCVNRVSSNVERARFSVVDVVKLTLGFYRRNMIEGLFLSSGIIRNEDYTMEQLVGVARSLREQHAFRGYIHLKTIAGADSRLIEEAGAWADRLSVNVELPSDDSLKQLAPEKRPATIRKAMAGLRMKLEEAGDRSGKTRPRRFAPAGQSTQMIIGADAAADREIMTKSAALYSSYALKRVYYSAFSPIPSPAASLPIKPAPLIREHRLYQADWLLRYYDFGVEEIFNGGDGMLDLKIDPKRAWALRNLHQFPLDVNTAPREMLLRTPGLGVRVVDKILAARRHGQLRLADIARLTRRIGGIRPFLTTPDWRPRRDLEPAKLTLPLAEPRQLELFAP